MRVTADLYSEFSMMPSCICTLFKVDVGVSLEKYWTNYSVRPNKWDIDIDIPGTKQT